MKPYDAETGSVWDFEGELFVMLDEFMDKTMLVGYRRYLSLNTAQLCWMGCGSERDDFSEPVA